MSTAPHPTARGLLVWMQMNNSRLLELVDDEAGDSVGLGPASDAAIQAHLRFVAEALAANAAPGQAAELEDLAQDLDARMARAAETLGDVFEQLEDATAFEAESQFGASVSDDTAFVAVLQRRLRVDAAVQTFLEALDQARPDHAAIRQPALDWWKANARRLAHMIFQADRAAKQALIDRGQTAAVNDPEIVNQIGQATMLQGHIKFLVEALAQHL